MIDAVAKAAEHFPIKGAIESIQPFGSGHINDTYRLMTTEGSYLIQCLNTTVFTEPEKMFSNLALLKPLVEQGLIVETLATKTGEPGLLSQEGVWRIQSFVDEVYGPEKAASERVAGQVARGFALFDHACLPLDPNQFEEVIPRFHDLSWRIDQFEESLLVASEDRLKEAGELIEQVKQFLWINEHMNGLWGQGLPLRVCHNDTKANNVLLSLEDDEYQYVIDLDTVGPGTILYDFGDLMRTMLSPTGESEPDATKIRLNINYYKSLAKAYHEVMWESISGIERASLVFGGMYMTFIMALRFLTDYLNGDVYYKTSFDSENWVRARNQLVLLSEINDQRETLEKIMNDL